VHALCGYQIKITALKSGKVIAIKNLPGYAFEVLKIQQYLERMVERGASIGGRLKSMLSHCACCEV